MLGFIFGTACLIGLVKVIKHGRYGGWQGGRYGDGPRRWMLRRLFQRLDTTVGQEKVISETFDDVYEKARAVREEMLRGRATAARAVRGEAFDTESVREQFEKQQAAFDEVKKAVVAGMQKIHEALTPEQRALAGDLIEFGPRGFGGGCGHRFAHHHHRHAAVNL